MSAPSQSLARSRTTTPEALLTRLDWHVLRRLDGQLQGDYRTVFLGDGLDVSDLRDYQPDDDVRRIDWNVTARMDSPFVRQYEEDRDVTAWFLIDHSLSMQFGTKNRSKADVVTDLSVALARVLTIRGNRVGAMLWSSGLDTLIEPRTGRQHVLRIAKALLTEPTPPSTQDPAAQGTALATLGHLLAAAHGVLRRPSLVFVISDFVSSSGWEPELRRLGVRHEVVAIRASDEQEHSLPDAGFVVVQDSETGEQMTVDTSDPKFRRRFEEAARHRREALRIETQRAGVDLFDISTGDDLAKRLVEMAAQRKARRR